MIPFLRWVRQHKASAAALVLVVAGCIALVLLARRVHHLRPKTAATAVVSTPTAVSDVQVGPGQSARSARMRAEFERAPRYLEFIQDAMGRPQEGGKFYALLAWRRCDELLARAGASPTQTGNDAFHAAALVLVEDLEKRCNGVQRAYPDIQALYRVVMDQRAGRDALMPAEGRGIVTPARREMASGDIDAALRSGDRWAQARALRDNADWLDVGNLDADDGLARQLKEWGAETVACELVGNCRGGLQAALHCVTTGDCAQDDYRDVVRAEVPEAHQILFDTVVDGMHLRMGLAPGRPSAEGDAK